MYTFVEDFNFLMFVVIIILAFQTNFISQDLYFENKLLLVLSRGVALWKSRIQNNLLDIIYISFIIHICQQHNYIGHVYRL